MDCHCEKVILNVYKVVINMYFDIVLLGSRLSFTFTIIIYCRLIFLHSPVLWTAFIHLVTAKFLMPLSDISNSRHFCVCVWKREGGMWWRGEREQREICLRSLSFINWQNVASPWVEKYCRTRRGIEAATLWIISRVIAVVH